MSIKAESGKFSPLGIGKFQWFLSLFIFVLYIGIFLAMHKVPSVALGCVGGVLAASYMGIFKDKQPYGGRVAIIGTVCVLIIDSLFVWLLLPMLSH